MKLALSRIYEGSSVLTLGAHGRLDGAPFVLAGRTCIRSESGGLWNEWRLRFKTGEERWLAEAHGVFTLFDAQALVPTFDGLRVGAGLETGFVVVEKGIATRVASWGEVPDAPKKFRYADLSSAHASATIDYGAGVPQVFVGARVSLAALDLVPRPEPPSFFPAPDVSRPKHVAVWLPLGATIDVGDLEHPTQGDRDERDKPDKRDKHRARRGAPFVVRGVLARSVRVDGERYTWEEYFLHRADAGYRWLVVADGHWNLVGRVEPGAVTETDRGATYDAVRFGALSAGTARIDWAEGAFPWQVAIGDSTRVADFVAGERVLSKEWSDGETGWSLGAYVAPDVLARASGGRALPKPIGRAPNQPKRSASASRARTTS